MHEALETERTPRLLSREAVPLFSLFFLVMVAAMGVGVIARCCLVARTLGYLAIVGWFLIGAATAGLAVT